MIGEKMENNPFESAKKQDRRIKLFLWGSWGVGKTTAALQFPNPILFDLDRGSELYGDKYNFDVLRSNSIAEIKNSIVWLINNPGRYETLIIDPITIYWEMLQKHWSDIFIKRLKGRSGNKHEFFELGGREWNTIKSDFKGLFSKLLELDMNVVVTAREAVKYKEGGEQMRVDGVRPDCEKRAPYVFDVVLHLSRDQNGKHTAECEKDRTGNLPTGTFDFSPIALLDFLSINKDNKKGQK